MAQTNLPYQLQDGQKSYAAKLMANFNALLNTVNEVNVTGMAAGDIDSVLTALKQLIDSRIVAYQTGNASQVKFADGDSMQTKLDNRELITEFANTQLNGMYKFYVDNSDGHLYLVAPADVDPPPFTIGEDGHLTYVIPDPVTETVDAAFYDLGNVRGTQGLPGDMDSSVYDTTGQHKDIFTAIDTAVAANKSSTISAVAYSASWDSGTKLLDVTAAGLTATANFSVDAAYSATDAQIAAWRGAMPRVTAQAAGQFTLKAYGIVPEVDIPLTVLVLP